MNTDNWLERTELLLGKEKLDLLRKAHVLVVGLGGVGAYAAEMIVRAGVGRMTIADADANKLRQMGDMLRDKAPNVVAVLATVNGEKITFLAVCGKEAVARGIKAGDLVRHVSAICGGKGGGKPDSAMGGGSDPLKVDDALASVDDFVSEKLG